MGLLLNAYYLQEEAARGRLDVVDETFAAARDLGAEGVRTWAFNDDPNKRRDSALQVGRLRYSRRGWAGLDRVLARARAHGVKLILPLVDYWSSYGGVRQWLRWNGIAGAVEGDPRFFTEPRVRDHYAAHARRLLRRKNPLTGIRYGEDDAVLAWELMNEPRGEARIVAEWVAFAAEVVRRDAAQLISDGGEGTDSDLFSRLAAYPGIDWLSCHFYPEKWGLPVEDTAWLAERARLAAGRPLYLGEFGLRSSRPLDERRRIYRRWLDACRDLGFAGAGPWLFSYDSRPAAWDEHTFYRGDYDAVLKDYASAVPPPSRYRIAIRTATP